MNTISEFLESALEKLLAVLMGAMVLDVTWQVFTRFILGDPSSYTEEIARFLLIWIGLMGAAYAYRKHSHLSLELLIHKLQGNSQLILVRVIQALSFLFAASVMVYGGVQLMLLTFEMKQITAATNVNMGYIYSCIPLSGLLICWFALEFFIYPQLALKPVEEVANVLD